MTQQSLTRAQLAHPLCMLRRARFSPFRLWYAVNERLKIVFCLLRNGIIRISLDIDRLQNNARIWSRFFHARRKIFENLPPYRCRPLLRHSLCNPAERNPIGGKRLVEMPRTLRSRSLLRQNNEVSRCSAAWGPLRQVFQGVVNCQDLAPCPQDSESIQRRRPVIPGRASRLRLPRAAINQDAPHGFGGSGKKVPPRIPMLGLFYVNEPDVRLMHHAVACSVCPGFSCASFTAANFRSSSYTSGNSFSAAWGSPCSICDKMRVTSDIPNRIAACPRRCQKVRIVNCCYGFSGSGVASGFSPCRPAHWWPSGGHRR